MKSLKLILCLFICLMTGNTLIAQTNRTKASAGRQEYIEVEKNVRLYVTDLGDGTYTEIFQRKKQEHTFLNWKKKR